MDILEFLDRNEFFKGLSIPNKRALAKAFRVKNLKKRERVFVEGQKGEGVFLLTAGSVLVYKTTDDGRQVVIKTIEPGELFGEVILFEKEHYPASAEAIQDASVLVLARSSFLKLLDQEDFRNDFIATLMGKMRYLTGRIMTLTAFDVEARFFRFLKEQYGEREEYELEIAKKDLAAAIGTNPETLSRLILRLRRDGVIEWEGRILKLKDAFWENF